MTRGIVYIIHFDMKNGSREHFVGFTRRTNLRDRMSEHKSHPETDLVKELFANCVKSDIEMIWPRATMNHERLLKAALVSEEVEFVCPICARLKFPLKKSNRPDLSA